MTDAGLNYFLFSSPIVSYPGQIQRPDQNKTTATATRSIEAEATSVTTTTIFGETATGKTERGSTRT